MSKHLFFNDYSEGAHPAVLELLSKSNLQQEMGYGEDSFTLKAQDLIRKQIGEKNAAVHFVSAGTQANLIALACMLKPYESVIAPESGHINVHEAGSIEATGHKINTVKTRDGKLTVPLIEEVLKEHNDEHKVKPKVVYISNSTELGTIYLKEELKAISAFCKKQGLYLYIDGARLGSALTSAANDVSLKDIGRLADMFYIGGTKNGALFGEAIVIVNPGIQEHFRYHLKQRGALLAKGRAVSVQFLALFTDDLYFQLAKSTNEKAKEIAEAIAAQGHSFFVASSTNQIFPILPNTIIESLRKDYGFYVWDKIDEHQSVIRLVTSWATSDQAVKMFIEDLNKMASKS